MSTTMLPTGSATGRSAPIAAAIASSISDTSAAPDGESRVLDGVTLDAREAARDAEDDARAETAPADRFADEVANMPR